jgi:hypothetical protein
LNREERSENRNSITSFLFAAMSLTIDRRHKSVAVAGFRHSDDIGRLRLGNTSGNTNVVCSRQSILSERSGSVTKNASALWRLAT